MSINLGTVLVTVLLVRLVWFLWQELGINAQTSRGSLSAGA